jgi:formyltetrahydrofolate deformylase
MSNAIILVSCPDKKGITATITNFVYENNGNIEHADQHIDGETNTFFMRIEWALKDFRIVPQKIYQEFEKIAKKFKMNWTLNFTAQIPRAAIFTSRAQHCLYDLLLRQQEGQFKCEIPLIIGNHPDCRDIARNFGIQFIEFPKTRKNKKKIEKEEIKLLKTEKIDLIILARYMQILSPDFVNQFPNRIINIHHSFLPAFIGSNPYNQAFQRGVKLIGATSHYVTKILDNGPIIEQDTVRVSHRDSLNDLKLKSKDLEKIVLSRAVRLHLERKILVYNNKTVVFD